MAIRRQSIAPGRNPLLELCPFCGEPGELYIHDRERGCRVRCSNPACVFRPDSNKAFATEELAIKAWNTHKGGLNARGDVKTVAKALLDETHDFLLGDD